MTSTTAISPAPTRGLPPRLVDPGRCLVMGVVNVTPDSFSDGGAFFDPGDAVAQGLALARAGADLIDVGGESTRPGADRVTGEEELRRVVPVVRALVDAGAFVSVDTMRACTARAALDAGAVMVNDVSGGLADPGMLDLVAGAGVPYVAMHWRGHSTDMASRATYDDVVAEVRSELSTRLAAAVAAGVDPEAVILDPGLGFAKTAEHNWALLAHLDALHDLGRPLLVGASRKSFLRALVAGLPGEAEQDRQLEDATAAVSALAAAAGAWCVRVHDAARSRAAVRVAAAVREAAVRDAAVRDAAVADALVRTAAVGTGR